MKTNATQAPLARARMRGRRPRTFVFGSIPAGLMVTLLAAQYLTGEAVNLFVHAPLLPFAAAQPMTAATVLRVALTLGRDGVLLGTHVLLGVAIGAIALVAVVLAALSGSARVLAWSVVSAVAVVISGVAGMTFVMGGQHAGASATMAAGFLVAFAASFLQLLASRRCH